MDWNAAWNLSPGQQPHVVDDPCLVVGSIIGCQNQSLGEAVTIVGTPFRLHYQSDRVAGRAGANSAAIAHARGLGGWTLNLHHAYDPDGNVLFLGDGRRRSADALGSVVQTALDEFLIAAADGDEVYVFNLSGRHLRTLNALTGAVRYEFTSDSEGRLTTITDGDGNVTTIERDAGGNRVAIVGPDGQRTTLTLDANGYLASIANPASEAYQLLYTADGLLTSLTTPRGHSSSFTYDAQGGLTRAQDPAGGSKALSRTDSTSGHTVALSTALGRTTRYQVENFSSGGQRRVNTFPGGLQTEWEKDASTRTLRFPDGAVTDIALSPDPRMGVQVLLPQSKLVTMPSGLEFTSTMGRTVTLADPADPLSLTNQTDTFTINGRTYTRLYDAARNTFTATTPEGRKLTTIVDAQGRVVKRQSGGFFPTSYVYDSRGRLSTITQGKGAAARTLGIGYNSDGYPASITDSLGRTESYSYDAAGRVIAQTLPDGRVIGYAYDAGGNLTAVTPPGRPAHTFTYTPVDLQSSYIPPDVGAGTNQTLYTNNADGQLTGIARPDGQTVGFSYDHAGRLDTVTVPSGRVQYAHDPTTGNLAFVTAADGSTLSYGYDGSLRTRAAWSGVIVGSVSRTYDNDFRTASLSVNDSDTINLQYDSESLLVRAGALTLARDRRNGLVGGTVLGSVADQWKYNGFGEPVGYTVKGFYTAQYTRDKLGRITHKVEKIGKVTHRYTYSYNLAGNLTEVRKNGTTIASYTYDSNGSRLARTDVGGTVTASYDAQDRLTQYDATTYTYTANGEFLSETTNGLTTTYDYDVLGNLIGVTLPDATQIEYLVDGQNRRVGKKINGTLVQGFLYQDGLKPIAELDGTNTVVSRFVYASRDNVPDYVVKGGRTYRVITDHLGSPRLIIDVAARQIVQRMDYDEFGRVTGDTNPGFQPFGFAGGLYDQHTGLARFGARDYDAKTGRWTAKDPILFAGADANLYAYVANDPVNWRDPSGKGWDFFVGLLRLIGLVPKPVAESAANAAGSTSATVAQGEDIDVTETVISSTVNIPGMGSGGDAVAIALAPDQALDIATGVIACTQDPTFEGDVTKKKFETNPKQQRVLDEIFSQ